MEKLNKEKILSKLNDMIINEDNKLLEYILENENVIFSDKEITKFLEKLSSNKDYQQYYTIAGSGGSKIIKPNITSIAFLYIASLGIPIIKTGSKAITGINGSTDLFKKLNLLNVDIKNEKYSFAYYEGYDVSLWKKYKNLLSINNSFKEYFNNNIFHDFELKSKITFQLNERNSLIYSKKKMLRAPKELFVIYNYNEELEIDEIIGGDIIVNKDKKIYIKNNQEIEKITTKEEVEKINSDLIFGNTKVNSFWFNTLKNEVSLFLYLNKFVSNIFEGENIFQDAYKERTVKKMLDYCTRKGGDFNEMD